MLKELLAFTVAILFLSSIACQGVPDPSAPPNPSHWIGLYARTDSVVNGRGIVVTRVRYHKGEYYQAIRYISRYGSRDYWVEYPVQERTPSASEGIFELRHRDGSSEYLAKKGQEYSLGSIELTHFGVPNQRTSASQARLALEYKIQGGFVGADGSKYRVGKIGTDWVVSCSYDWPPDSPQATKLAGAFLQADAKAMTKAEVCQILGLDVDDVGPVFGLRFKMAISQVGTDDSYLVCVPTNIVSNGTQFQSGFSLGTHGDRSDKQISWLALTAQ